MRPYVWVFAVIGLVLLWAAGAAKETGTAMETADAIPTGFLNKTLESNGKTYRYVVYVPQAYMPEKAWPMILSLHGAGERGDDGLLQTEVGIGTALRRHPDLYPAIVVMPQCPKRQFFDAMLDALDQCIERTFEEYTIDRSRVYLTGLSMGGYAAWIWGATKTDVFAALMPICGGGSYMDVKKLCNGGDNPPFGTLRERVKKLATIPIWAFHGTDDLSVPPQRSEQIVKLVREAGGNVQYTVFPDTAHNSWDKAYAHEEAVKWLFEQRKK